MLLGEAGSKMLDKNGKEIRKYKSVKVSKVPVNGMVVEVANEIDRAFIDFPGFEWLNDWYLYSAIEVLR